MVFVDPLMQTVRSAKWPFPQSCHMVADTLVELHRFALSIGLRREWFQDHARVPHYDLNASRRAAALRKGATELTRREFYERFLRRA